MSDQHFDMPGGWLVSPSIAMELDAMLAMISGRFSLGTLPAHLLPLVEQTPAEWLAELPALLGDLKGPFGLLTHMADWAGVLESGEYGGATLAMRQASAEEILLRLGGEVGESLADLQVRRVLQAELAAGLEPESVEARRMIYHQEAAQAARLLAGGDLAAHFWHWLDRFYYQVYQPWRETRLAFMQEQERHALAVLGERESAAQPPRLDWLPAQNPLVNRPALNESARLGRLRVIFWVEPFGIADLWAILPGKLLAAIAEPGVFLQNFYTFAEDVAGRAQALADPTRLVILRMIRHFGMTNTEIASYLGISRPTVSVHAKILREAGLIETSEAGRAVQHTIKPATLRQLFKDLQQFLDLPEG